MPRWKRDHNPEVCDFSSLPTGRCPHCQAIPHLGDGRPRGEQTRPWTIAQQVGVCTGCGQRIRCGDDIQPAGDGHLLCADCGED